MYRTSVLAFVLLCCVTVQAQKELTVDLSATFVSSYIFRGTQLGKASVQPNLQLGYRGFLLDLWGNCELAGDAKYKEFDITLFYKIGQLKFKVQDTWTSNGGDPKGRYFMYNAHSTNHVFEANVSYDFGFISTEWNTIFAGYDGVNSSGKRAYSSYFEAQAPFRLAGVDFMGVIGVVPYASSIFGASGLSVVNVQLKATRDIKVTDTFSIPAFIEITANPSKQNAYLVFGVKITPFSFNHK